MNLLTKLSMFDILTLSQDDVESMIHKDQLRRSRIQQDHRKKVKVKVEKKKKQQGYETQVQSL